MPKPEIELTAAEWTVIKAIWEKEPCTAPEVQKTLERQTTWTYSTVWTLMDRMLTKGLLKADKQRHPTVYRSAISRAQAQKGELLYALKHAFNGAASPMVQCLLGTAKLSSGELDRIKKIIAEHEQRAGSKGGKKS